MIALARVMLGTRVGRWALLALVVLTVLVQKYWTKADSDRLAASISASVCAEKPTPAVCVTGAAAAAPAPPPPAAPAAPSGPGVVYSEAQMEAALLRAGVPEPSAHTGAAIGEAESGGRSDAVHLCPPRCDPGQAPERSYGPWQINLLAHPWVSAACAMALACAASAAAAISDRGRNWWPWSTYASGAWRRYA